MRGELIRREWGGGRGKQAQLTAGCVFKAGEKEEEEGGGCKVS